MVGNSTDDDDSVGTIRSDCSSSDEEHFAKLDRPCTLTELKMIAKASIEKRRE